MEKLIPLNYFAIASLGDYTNCGCFSLSPRRGSRVGVHNITGVHPCLCSITPKRVFLFDARGFYNIGAGPYVDGQVLVVNDMLGMSKDFYPKFLRQYADLQSIITDAVGNYVRDVKNNIFPSLEESY